MNLAHLLARAARVMPSHVAVCSGAQPLLDYRTLASQSMGLAGALRTRFGLQPGDRVVIAMSNSPAYIEALFGCWWAGVIAVPINVKLHAREIAYILDDCGAGLVLTSVDLETTVAEALSLSTMQPAVLIAETAEWRKSSADAVPQKIHPALAQEAAWLFYTSGTTGKPKGATLSHRNLLTMTAAYLSEVDLTTARDAIIHAAPMSHGSGLYILPHVSAMATQVVPESGGFDPNEVLELIQKIPRSSFFAAPTMVHRLVSASASSSVDARQLRTIIYGGGPMYLANCKAALEVFGPRLAQIYGQGESPMTITVLPKHVIADASHPRHEQRLTSVGYAQGVVEVMIADAQDRPLPPGEVGEVLVRGDTVMSGYWNKPAANAETLRGGWLHTGDMGEFDTDGFLTLRDRSKDVIISGGSNIYPREIEEVLLTDPRVQEASVIGRPHPEWGEEVIAFVVAENIDSRELDALCIANIARFKRPKHYRFVASLPKNSYGKVLKTELRRWLADTPPHDRP